MKKIFKALTLLIAVACCACAFAFAGCDAGYNGTYTGEYHYVNYGQTYGMKVEVTVENNIITKVKDITPAEWHDVSASWVDYYCGQYDKAWYTGPKGVTPEYKADGVTLTDESIAAIEALDHANVYGWDRSDVAKWNTYKAWLLQQYKGMAVSDVLEIEVYVNEKGEPYGVKDGYNASFSDSGLLISNATQGSGRLLLAIQNALSK